MSQRRYEPAELGSVHLEEPSPPSSWRSETHRRTYAVGTSCMVRVVRCVGRRVWNVVCGKEKGVDEKK